MEDSIRKSLLARYLSETIEDIVRGEGGLIEMAREIANGDPHVPLEDESCEAVGRILWETRSPEMAVAARYSGYLTALFDLAGNFDIELTEAARGLREWDETIHPA